MVLAGFSSALNRFFLKWKTLHKNWEIVSSYAESAYFYHNNTYSYFVNRKKGQTVIILEHSFVDLEALVA